MLTFRVFGTAFVAALVVVVPLRAQAVTAVQLRGTLRDGAGALIDGARVRLAHDLTGASVEGAAPHGRYVLSGLEPGGPYTLVVRRIGYQSAILRNITLRLGEAATIDVVLASAATLVDTVSVVAARPGSSSPSVAGAATTVSDSLLHRLPTINRGIYDFVVLAPGCPRIGLAAGGMSAGGASLRFNNFLIDGAPERLVTGNSAPAYGGGKSVPIEAVKEYQVLVAPFDVRYGDFAGGLVNTVTVVERTNSTGRRSGFGRNNDLSRQRDATADGTAPAAYDRWQYGALFSGPILRDRIHFLVAPEWQRLTQNAVGPYLGQPSTSVPSVPVTSADVSRMADVLRGFRFYSRVGRRGDDAESFDESVRARRHCHSGIAQPHRGDAERGAERHHEFRAREHRHVRALQLSDDARSRDRVDAAAHLQHAAASRNVQ